jgi:hypothetical protein
MRRPEHLIDDCPTPDIWRCPKTHRIMSRKAEADLQRYSNEWVLLDKREGVIYHGDDPSAIMKQAWAERGRRHGLILHRVPEPGVAYIL